jgi:hypothetical protein
VPAVLNMISSFEAAMKPRTRLGMGACLPALAGSATPASEGAVVFARPRTDSFAGFTEMGQLPVLAAANQAAGHQTTRKQCAYKTPTIAGGAGDLGPHPVREPPV